MSIARNERGEKRCGFGDGHWTDPARFNRNRTKPDGLNGICSYHQGVVDARRRAN